MELQDELRQRLVLAWDGRPVRTVGGVDIHIKEEWARAALVVFRFPELTPLEAQTAESTLSFPYVPGLLAFREGPAVLQVWEKLRLKPDLLLFDGQGIAHPRGLGIAAHMGLWLDRPSVGVAKSRLYGWHEPPGPQPGDGADLFDERIPERRIGAVMRTRQRSNPLYVSPGHLIDVDTAVEFVLRCSTGYRLPQPTRWAHKVAGGEAFPV